MRSTGSGTRTRLSSENSNQRGTSTSRRQLILILSGSLTSWIERNILHSTGFVGRIHVDLTLDELPLRDCAPFLPAGSDGIFGLQFENLILKNRAAVWSRLGINADDIVFDNPFWQTATRRNPGCQIDYMIQCRNNTVYVCEIKFAKQPVGRAIIPEVEGKIRKLAKPRNFSFRPVLIHVNGVEDQVPDSRYFDAVIDFGELWQ